MDVDLERAAHWISEHPWRGMGLAFLGGIALGFAESLPRTRALARSTIAAFTGTALAALREEVLKRASRSWTDYRERPVAQA
ncbi:MAG TPA: hypothetical protein VLB44_11805 [Kofleriaceae bacterium]|nr:hypothetical protein [Kofleriaceae bacterium]